LVRLAFLPGSAEPVGRYVLAQGLVVLRYLQLLVVPYGFSVDPDLRVPPAILGILAWAAVVALAWLAWRRQWWWLLAGLILLIPSSLFPAAELAADRRLYLPLFALAAAGALACERLPTSAAAPAALTAIVVLTAVSISRTFVWSDDRLLWREAVERAPEKVRPKIELARVLPASQALEVLASARRLAPQDPRIAAETGRILLAQGQPDAALDEFSHALAANPRDALSLNNRGVAFGLLGQSEAARADFERALQIDPTLDQARENLAKLTGAK
jgi:tetratricopeptide (TPR) repeat protein